jgi:thioredoxin reductase (NADPH)
MTEVRNIIVIGSGPAGYTAALYAQRSGLNPLLITGMEIGGQLMQTTGVENFPGFVSIQGHELMSNMESQIKHLGTEIIIDHITSVEKTNNVFKIQGESTSYLAKTVVVATGSSAKWLGVKGEDTFKGFGVSSCATCDGFFFKNQVVAVIGGGNTAIEEAIYLAAIASKVYLIHRRDTLRGEHIMQTKLFNTKNIVPIWDTVIEEIQGDTENKAVNQLSLKNLKTNNISSLAVDGVFVAIGHTPNTTFLQNKVDVDESGYIITKDNGCAVLYKGNVIGGLFAAGDVKDSVYRQAITSAGSGCMAAIDAQHYILMNE